jgi:hypothetical protein
MPITPGSNSCGADTAATSLYDDLVDENDFVFPEINFNEDNFKIPESLNNPLYDAVDRVTMDQLTTRVIGGAGVYDAMMEVTALHLEKEFKAQRISGREYADVYTASIQAAMGQAVNFLMGKDQAYWQAIMTQNQARRAEIEAVIARIELENAKLQYFTLKANAKTSAVEYATKKLQLAITDVEYCNKILEKDGLQLDVEAKKFSNDFMLPLQLEQLTKQNAQILAQTDGIVLDTEAKQYRLDFMYPVELQTAQSNMESAGVDRDMKVFQMSDILPWQAKLTREQAEAARGQTLGTRSDGAPLGGLMGLQLRQGEYTVDFMLPEQLAMIQEQVEVQRAQTMDTRRNLTVVTGSVGKQKELYTQQIISYQKDAEVKAAKMFVDAFLAQKAINESLDAPNVLGGESVNQVMNAIKLSNILGPETPWVI